MKKQPVKNGKVTPTTPAPAKKMPSSTKALSKPTPDAKAPPATGKRIIVKPPAVKAAAAKATKATKATKAAKAPKIPKVPVVRPEINHKPPVLPETKDLYDQLAEDAWAVIPNFLSPNLVLALREDLQERQAAGEFKKAGVGKGKKYRLDADIRADSVLWLDADTATPVQKKLFAKIEELRETINKELFLGLSGFEGHYASYPRGGRYERHKDTFHQDDNRSMSFVLYLNERWQSEWGGQLRLFEAKAPTKIAKEVEPRGGTLALFMSSEIEHEVVASGMERLSFTGWFLQKDR